MGGTDKCQKGVGISSHDCAYHLDFFDFSAAAPVCRLNEQSTLLMFSQYNTYYYFLKNILVFAKKIAMSSAVKFSTFIYTVQEK